MKQGDLVGGKYRLTRSLGVGAMGAVWEAINERTSRKVALKLILNPTPDHRRRLLREARACGSIEHRNIVEIYDVSETETGDPFLVMQLLTGETLGELLRRRRRLEPAFAARIARDIAAALAVAHDAKVVHRDLKPANIFLHRAPGAAEDDFVLKVLDFGVSKDRKNADPSFTATNMIVGSPAYMSPEQILVDKDIDGRSDLWSLGILLFEMLTGVRPFVEKSIKLIEDVLGAPIPPVSSHVRQIPPELDAVVARCLERDLTRRYQDARELGRDLGAFVEVSQRARLDGNMVALSPASPMPPASGARAEHRPPSSSSMRAVSAGPLDNNAQGSAAVGLWGTQRLPNVQARPLAVTGRGTQILPTGALVPSGGRDMQKAPVNREPAASSAVSLGLAKTEEAPYGGRGALPSEPFAHGRGPSGRNMAVTTTAPLVQHPPLGDLPELALHQERAPARERGGSARLAAWGGGGAFTVVVLALLFWKMLAPAASSPVEQPFVPAPPEAPVAPLVKQEPVAPPPTETSASAPTPNTLPPEPVKSVTTVAPPAPPPVHTAVVAPHAPAPVSKPPASKPALPPCGPFIRVNCAKASPPAASPTAKHFDPKRP